MQNKNPPSSAEFVQWMVDDLMSRIEPELVSHNRPLTVRLFRYLSQKELNERLEDYAEAYETFMKLWPGYIKEKMAELETMKQKVKNFATTSEQTSMQSLEGQFSDMNE